MIENNIENNWSTTTRSTRSKTLEFIATPLCWISIFLYFRRNAIFSHIVLNPDEAELIATGQRVGISLIPYEKFTTPTFGPIWAYFLGILNKLGLPMTIPIAHLLSALLSSLVIIIVFTKVSSRWGFQSALVLVSPLGLLWAAGNIPRSASDVNALGTLQLPLLITTVAFAIYANKNLKKFDLINFGVLIGLAALAKYQIFPIIFFTGVLLILTIKNNDKTSGKILKIGLFLVGMAIPIVVLVIVTAIFGNIDKLWFEGVGFMKDYVLHRQKLTGSMPLEPSSRIASTVEFIFQYPAFLYLLIFATIFAKIKKGKPADNGGSQNGFIFIWIVLIASLFLTSPLFPNYALVILFAAIPALFICMKEVRLNEDGKLIKISLHAVKSQVVLLLPMLLTCMYLIPMIGINSKSDLKFNDLFSIAGGQKARVAEDGVNYIGKYCPPGSKVFVYGWSGEMYSENLWEPASRYVISTWLLMGTSEKKRYLQILLDELKKDKPDCVIEALGPGFFGPFGVERSIQNEFPALYRQLQINKYRVEEGNFSGSSPVRIFVSSN